MNTEQERIRQAELRIERLENEINDLKRALAVISIEFMDALDSHMELFIQNTMTHEKFSALIIANTKMIEALAKR